MKTPTWQTKELVVKECTKCSVTKDLNFFYVTGKKVGGSPKYNSWCKKCISVRQATYYKNYYGEEQIKFSAFKRTKSARAYLQYLRSKAVSRKKPGEVISLDALELLWNIQNGCCALTGWQMTMELSNGVVQTNCSLDRIDSSIGYVVGNVQLVCRIANVSKTALSTDDFIKLCQAVLEQNNAKN